MFKLTTWAVTLKTFVKPKSLQWYICDSRIKLLAIFALEIFGTLQCKTTLMIFGLYVDYIPSPLYVK